MDTANRFFIWKTHEILVMLLHKFLCHCLWRRWDSVISIVAELLARQLRNCGLILYRNKIFLVFKVSWLALGPTQQPVEWVPGTISLGVKWLEQRNGQTSPSNAEVKNDGQCTSIRIFVYDIHRAALPVTVFVDFIDEGKQGCSAHSLCELIAHDTVLLCAHRHLKWEMSLILPLAKLRYNAEAVFGTNVLYIYREVHYIIN
jgi:hypothetical protein